MRAARLESLDGRTVGLLDISKPRGDVFLDRIEAVTDYEAPEFGRTDDLVEVEYGPIVHGDESHDDEEGGG